MDDSEFILWIFQLKILINISRVTKFLTTIYKLATVRKQKRSIIRSTCTNLGYVKVAFSETNKMS